MESMFLHIIIYYLQVKTKLTWRSWIIYKAERDIFEARFSGAGDRLDWKYKGEEIVIADSRHKLLSWIKVPLTKWGMLKINSFGERENFGIEFEMYKYSHLTLCVFIYVEILNRHLEFRGTIWMGDISVWLWGYI